MKLIELIGAETPLLTINRTTLELKCGYLQSGGGGECSINRTTLELKFAHAGEVQQVGVTINRTTLELKFLRPCLSFINDTLLIAPHWN